MDRSGGCELSVRRDRHVLQLCGEADLSTAGVLLDALDSASGHVVLDCSQLTFCDVTSLGAIIRRGHALARDGGSLTLQGTSATLRLALRALGLGERFA